MTPNETPGAEVAWILGHAPLDDETETEDERQAIAEARADGERGIEPVPLENVIAEFDGDPPLAPGTGA